MGCTETAGKSLGLKEIGRSIVYEHVEQKPEQYRSESQR